MLSLDRVTKVYRYGFAGSHHKTAVDQVSFCIPKETTLGLVGNSGCGKSTIARMILGLLPPTAGTITFEGQNLSELKGAAKRQLSKKAQIVFQHPESSLNPQMTVEENLLEPILIQQRRLKSQAPRLLEEKLNLVGLSKKMLPRYPHEISGGEAQRIVIARVLLMDASFIILDEPTSMLDISVQSQIMNLLKALQQEFHLTYLFISHDLEIVQLFAHSLCIMENGRIIEEGDTAAILQNPKQAFTKDLVDTFRALSLS